MIHDVLPSGSVAVDVALEIGGWPRGHIVEFFGAETTGKSTLSLLACRAAQRAGGEAAYVDVDGAFDVGYATALGLDLDRLAVAQPGSGEEALGVARTFLRHGIAAVVIDSVAAVTPGAICPAPPSSGKGGDEFAMRRRLIDRGVRELFHLAAERGAVVVAVNRPAMRLDRATGAWVEGSAAGDVLPSVAAVRVHLSQVAGDATQTRVRAAVIKNAAGHLPVPRFADVLFRWGAGVDRSTDILVAAFDLGVIAAHGGRFYFDGSCLGGIEVARTALLGPVGERVQAAILAVAPWRAPAPLSAEEAVGA